MHFQSSFKIKKCPKIWVGFLAAAFVCIKVLVRKGEKPMPKISHEGGVIGRFQRFIEESRFANFNNETGAEELIVPNIIHFIIFQNPTINFAHFICILAAMRNQKPEKIYFHTNVDRLKGQYWTRLMSLEQFTNILEIKKLEMPKEIFKQKIRPVWQIFHGGDIARLQVLMEYGGIYLDNDSYIVKSLDFYRKFEMAIGWDQGQSVGTQIIVAHKEARFLHLWLHTYDGAYDAKKWYFNAGVLPTDSVLCKRPDLVHRVKVLFGNDNRFIKKLFQRYWPDWRKNYVFHLLARKVHQRALHSISKNAPYPVDFNEFNLQKYPITFKEMANEVLFYEKSLRSSKEQNRTIVDQ